MTDFKRDAFPKWVQIASLPVVAVFLLVVMPFAILTSGFIIGANLVERLWLVCDDKSK